MSDKASPPPLSRPGKRVPSGPRPPPVPLRGSPTASSRVTSSSSIPKSSIDLRGQTSSGSFGKIIYDSPDASLDVLIDSEAQFTTSPDGSPVLLPVAGPSSPARDGDGSLPAASHAARPRGQSQPDTALPMSREDSATMRGKTINLDTRSITPTPFLVSRPPSPAVTSSVVSKPKPKPSRLNTSNLLMTGSTSPIKAVSPGMKHWQQVRSHVIAPTPVEERAPAQPSRHPAKKMTGLVSKAAGRFGFRHAADNVIGYSDRRASMMGMMAEMADLTPEEKEAIARERRKFARDIKTCLDACALEESRRRLHRTAYEDTQRAAPLLVDPKSSGTSVHTSVHTAQQRFAFDPDFSPFAPLLGELHKYLPAARAKKAWSRTCPHHSAILAELGVAFLHHPQAADGDRQQALEVFGVVVKNWAADSADEDLERWLWLCRALLCDDRQLRKRGLALLSQLLRDDSSLPRGPERPRSALAFLSLASALIQLLHAIETSNYDHANDEHIETVNELISDLRHDRIFQVEEASVTDLIGIREIGGSVNIGKELFWIAVSVVGVDHPSLLPWLITDEHPVIDRFAPPHMLHAAPPTILHLRGCAISVMLDSFATFVASSVDTIAVVRIWHAVESRILPEIDHLSAEDGSLAVSLATFLFQLELHNLRISPAVAETLTDPFKISLRSPEQGLGKIDGHRPLLVKHSSIEASWRRHFETAATNIIASEPLGATCGMLQAFLQDRALVSFGRSCIEPLLRRFSGCRQSCTEVQPFLAWLVTSFSPLLYKSLFNCSAATSASALVPHLRVVTAVSDLLGPSVYWTQADPQMIVIVLMGQPSPKEPKGKGKEGEMGLIAVKLGRYAVLVELILALEDVTEAAGSGTRLRLFIEAVEARLTEKEGRLPAMYRGLVCQLLLRFRRLTMSSKRPPWIHVVISWFKEYISRKPEGQVDSQDAEHPLEALQSVYGSLAPPPPEKVKSVKQVASAIDQRTIKNPPTARDRRCTISEQGVELSISELIVMVHGSLAVEDWQTMVPLLWGHCGRTKNGVKPISFLIAKCAEKAPQQLKAVITSDLQRTMCALFGWRWQVLSQRFIIVRRGPIFHFDHKTLDFVATEIGSREWTPPHDIKDAVLSRYGRTLPLELRQRLMELGWGEDDSLQAASDAELVPVSSIPSLQRQQDEVNTERSSNPLRSLSRQSSTGSANSWKVKQRRAVIAPGLVDMFARQTSLLRGENDGSMIATSREAVLLLERDDPDSLLRPISDCLSEDTAEALSVLHCVNMVRTPASAHVSLNALVGFLKADVSRITASTRYAAILTTIARIIPGVSEISLRDIRKNKAESVLLPASIHEDAAGFKVHTPWRAHQLDVQTAQVLLITETLRANPREVYLVKKMLFNLQIRDSIAHLPFARAWLGLVVTLFSAVNRNYNDRAELRHFLSNIGAILSLHGQSDLLITAHAMRVFMLCSARFRRLFISMGFANIMRPIYDTYAHGNSAVTDCIEYACRSFYRIHQDTFVYQACVVISEGDYDPASVFALLASLSKPNSSPSGVASGIQSLNNHEELEALVQMLSGPEIALSEIGTKSAERQASKIAQISLDGAIFPQENIIKLFMTVIAANPATLRAANFLRLLSALVPYINDPASQELLHEGVEALGSVIQKGRTGDEAAMLAFNPGEENHKTDWIGARREYVSLVEAYAGSGGHLSASAMKRTLEMVLDLLRRIPESVGPAASSIISALGKTHLSTNKPARFLRDIAPLFRSFIAVVDFAGLLDSIVLMIKRSNYDLDDETTAIVIESYVGPAVMLLASASEDNMAFIVPLRASAVRLLAAAVFLPGDALSALERHAMNAGLLASLVLPLCLTLESPEAIDKATLCSSLWVRLLHYVILPPPTSGSDRSNVPGPLRVEAATATLTFQIIKTIAIRAPDSISSIPGLWPYISLHLLQMIQDGRGALHRTETAALSPRMLDWVMWSLFELLSLHPSPLVVFLRENMQLALSASHVEDETSNPPSPGPGLGPANKASWSPSRSLSMAGRARRVSSARSPPAAFHSRMPSAVAPDVMISSGHSPMPSGQLTPDGPFGHSRAASQNLSPFFLGVSPTAGGHSRMVSQGSVSFSAGIRRSGSTIANQRSSFAALSSRRASRPAFEAFPSDPGVKYRFPSSAGVRNLRPNNEKAGGAIVHLLSAPNQVLSATSTPFLTVPPSSPRDQTWRDDRRGTGEDAHMALKEVYIKSDRLAKITKRAVRVVQMVNGWAVDHEENEEAITTWSVSDALHVVSEQTKILVEEEFLDIFSPSSHQRSSESGTYDLREKVPDGQEELDKRESGFSLIPEGYRMDIQEEEEEGGFINPFATSRSSNELEDSRFGKVPLLSFSPS
ncbi:hypothetical protein IAU60_000915 [Kwoniella sp. DSM 27419]